MNNMAPAFPQRETSSADTAGGDKVRVLLVDDDERNLIAIRSIMEGIADVVTVSSGEEALRELLRGNFAVILLDVIMPGMDGYETAALIRAREQTKHIPIIFLSAVNKDEPHLLRGYSMGAVDYVFKPVEPLILRSKVQVFVDLCRMSREVAEKAAREKALLDEALRSQAERVAAERDLRLSEELQAAIIKSLPLVLYVDDEKANGQRAFVEGAIAGLFNEEREGCSLDELLEWLHPEDRDALKTALGKRKKDGHAAVKYRIRGIDGRYRYILDQSARLNEDPGVFAGTLLDVTERKELEHQLVQAQKMDALGKLTGGIAHDFNNLLAAVISGVDILERRVTLAEREKKISTMIRHAAEQGAELIKRLLAFSRTQRLEPSRVNLEQLSADVGQLLAHTLGGRVKLVWRVAEDSWLAFADKSQLQLALMNLVINARDAMPDGGMIEVTSINRHLQPDNGYGLAAGDYVTIAVKDEGIGMSDDVLEQVMEPFFTTKEVGKGTGLGLSMVYGFAKQSGGTLDIESAVGAGTNVEVWLPRAPEGTDNAVPEEFQQSLSAEKLEEPLRVILVDDHDGVRQATAALLEDAGASVTEFASGEEMLQSLSCDPEQCDVVITDYAMPGIAGDEAIQRARAIANEIGAVIITGHANPRSLVALPEQTVLLNKPFTPAKLLHALRSSRAMLHNSPNEQ